MNMVLSILSYYLFVSAGMAAFFAAYSFFKIKSGLAKIFSFFCISVSIYLFGYLLEFNSITLDNMILWNQIQYIGVPFIPAFWLLLTIKYFKSKYVFKKISLAFLFLIPVLTFFLHLTNKFHFLFYSKIELADYGAIPVLLLGKGPWYIVHFTFVTLCFLFSIYLYFTRLKYSESQKRKGVILMIAASLFLWAGVLLNILNPGLTGLDFAAFVFPVSCALLFTSIFRYEFLNLKPLALKKVFESTNNGIIVLNEKNCIIDFSPSAADIFKELRKNALGKPLRVILQAYEDLIMAINDKKNIQFTINRNGNKKYYYAVISNINNNGVPAGYLLTLTDITEHKEDEMAIETSERRLKKAQAIALVGNWELDIASRQIWASEEAFKIYGIEQESPYLKLETVQNVVSKDDRPKMDLALKLLLERNNIYDVEFKIKKVNSGKERILHSKAEVEFDENNKPLKVIGVIRDITDRKNGEKEVLYLSYHDQLTGLYNRRFYEEELKRLDTKRNFPMTLVIADVNGLKLTNDAFGHLKGDRLLIKIGQAIKEECRSDDIVARLGGDEFILLLPKTGSAEAEKIVKRINEKITNIGLDKIISSVSFGFASKSDPSESMLAVFKKAEDKMYKNKLVENTAMKHDTINNIIKILIEKNKRERMHSERVIALSEDLAAAFNVSAQKISEIKTLGLVHDIGKIGIDNKILESKNELSELEYIEIKRHSEIGYRILSSLNEFSQIAEFVLAHHERWDGKGYPKGLSGENIPFESRIIAIADSFEAMTGERSYKKTLSENDAIEEIIKNAGSQFDPEISKIFVEKVLKKKWIPQKAT
ncbi:MAG: histidine kinase N-terminal 7TM domain-containing protein [Candidatus Humimicrobiaceae bacterium]